MQQVKIDNWDARIYYDTDNKVHTITYAGEGGAIVSHTNKKEGMKLWITAMQLSDRVTRLLNNIKK